MADQPEDPRARRGSGSDDPDQPLDRTAPFDPIRDDDEDGDDPGDAERTQRVSPPDEPEATRRLPEDPDRTARIEPQADDRTTQVPSAGGRVPDDDRTTQISRPGDRAPDDDRTTRIQQNGPRNATPPADRAWAGRAGIPQPGGPGGPPDDGPPDRWQPGPPDGRRWWMPILIGIIALILLGVLAFGLWLILRGDGGPTPEPSPTTPAATTPAPTSAAPTTSSPSPTATTPAAVAVPILEGLTVAEAGQRLAEVGLNSRLNFVDSDRPADTVLDSDPGPGTQVQPGSTVTLDVSSGPPATPATPTPTATTTPTVPPGR